MSAGAKGKGEDNPFSFFSFAKDETPAPSGRKKKLSLFDDDFDETPRGNKAKGKPKPKARPKAKPKAKPIAKAGETKGQAPAVPAKRKPEKLSIFDDEKERRRAAANPRSAGGASLFSLFDAEPPAGELPLFSSPRNGEAKPPASGVGRRKKTSLFSPADPAAPERSVDDRADDPPAPTKPPPEEAPKKTTKEKVREQNPFSFSHWMSGNGGQEGEEDEDEDDDPDISLPEVNLDSPVAVRRRGSHPHPAPAPPSPGSSSDDGDDDGAGIVGFLKMGQSEGRLSPTPRSNAGLLKPSAELRRMTERALAAEQSLSEERNRLRLLEKQVRRREAELRRIKEKEAEETRQLKEFVHGVEENLAVATDRAEQMERKVAELQAEVTRARRQGYGNGRTPEERDALAAANAKADMATDKLNKAAADAEESVKKLLGGVSTLREIAQLLHSLDRITAVDE